MKLERAIFSCVYEYKRDKIDTKQVTTTNWRGKQITSEEPVWGPRYSTADKLMKEVNGLINKVGDRFVSVSEYISIWEQLNIIVVFYWSKEEEESAENNP